MAFYYNSDIIFPSIYNSLIIFFLQIIQMNNESNPSFFYRIFLPVLFTTIMSFNSLFFTFKINKKGHSSFIGSLILILMTSLSLSSISNSIQRSFYAASFTEKESFPHNLENYLLSPIIEDELPINGMYILNIKQNKKIHISKKELEYFVLASAENYDPFNIQPTNIYSKENYEHVSQILTYGYASGVKFDREISSFKEAEVRYRECLNKITDELCKQVSMHRTDHGPDVDYIEKNLAQYTYELYSFQDEKDYDEFMHSPSPTSYFSQQVKDVFLSQMDLPIQRAILSINNQWQYIKHPDNSKIAIINLNNRRVALHLVEKQSVDPSLLSFTGCKYILYSTPVIKNIYDQKEQDDCKESANTMTSLISYSPFKNPEKFEGLEESRGNLRVLDYKKLALVSRSEVNIMPTLSMSDNAFIDRYFVYSSAAYESTLVNIIALEESCTSEESGTLRSLGPVYTNSDISILYVYDFEEPIVDPIYVYEELNRLRLVDNREYYQHAKKEIDNTFKTLGLYYALEYES